MKKKDEVSAAKQVAALTTVMAVALLFLGIVLGRSAVVQLRAAHTFSGCISIAGTVLILLVSVLMFCDLYKKRQK